MKKLKFWLLAIIIVGFAAVAGSYLHRTNIPVLEPRGIIAGKEQHLIIIALLLSLIVVIPVFTFAIVIAWRYRETNQRTNRKYSPDWDGSRFFESLWWGIPILIITVLSVITWQSSQALDPYKPISSSQPPLHVQVVALDWKWLFIYPQQHVASVNLLEMPVGTPVNFELTSDTVMNSFWVPQLGSQIYAMPGMTSQLHLLATQPGSYRGSSANISGRGFASMTFTAKATSLASFNQWTRRLQRMPASLTTSAYQQLAAPSANHPVSYYSLPNAHLFDEITAKYMAADNSTSGMVM